MPDIIPNPDPQPRPQQQFLGRLQRLDSLLLDRGHDGTSSTLRILLKEIQGAAAMVRGGFSPKGCQDFATQRLTWRVQYDLVDPSTFDDAMQLLQAIILQGIELLRPIDWRKAGGTLLSAIAAQTGVDLRL